MKAIKERLTAFIDNIFYPKNPVCCVCQRVLFTGSSDVCERCFDHFTHICADECIMCAKKIPSQTLPVCSSCMTDEYSFCDGCASYAYDEYSEKLVWDFKYSNNKYAAKYASELMYEDVKLKPWIKEIDIITCVPALCSKIEQRGYNQSAVIAEELSIKFQKQLDINLLYADDTLEDQIGLGFKERFENVKGKYKLVDNKKVKNKTLLITDDVFTSGATLNECTRRLLEAGAHKVYFAVFAAATHKNKER